MSNKPTIIPGTSCAPRVEYRACQPDVEVMLAKGYSIRMVYEHLKEEGRVSCSYSAFCDYVRGNGTRKHSRRKKPLPQANNRPLTERSAPNIAQVKPGGFPDPRTMRVEDAT